VKDAYQVEQLIDHPSFGLGIVSGVREDKVDVVFKSFQKTLVHRRAESSSPKPSFHPPRPALDNEDLVNPEERDEEAQPGEPKDGTTRPL
jgi:hypothetical protein